MLTLESGMAKKVNVTPSEITDDLIFSIIKKFTRSKKKNQKLIATSNKDVAQKFSRLR